jgi:hypothetical protein
VDDRQRSALTGTLERYHKAVRPEQVVEMLAGRREFANDGPLSGWLVIWLMMFQRLHPLGTLEVAVRELVSGPVRRWVGSAHRAVIAGLSSNTSAYSQARKRLPLEVAGKVSDVMFEALLENPVVLPGLEQPMFLLDGTTLSLSHSKDLGRAYPAPHNQHGTSHWPAMRVLVAHEVVSGLAARPCWGPVEGPKAASEQGLAKEMLRRLPKGSVVLGDRNFGVFSMAWHARQNEHPCLFRLTAARARKLNGGVSPNPGTDRRIVWACSREDRCGNPELAPQASVKGRLIAANAVDAAGKTQTLYFFTSLELPVERILELYGYRWNIETDLRSLKREVRLHMLTAKSKDMVEKELVLGVAAYNLTRAAIQEAARLLELPPRRFSFSKARATINAFMPLFAAARGEEEERQLGAQLLRMMSQSLLPRRRKRRPAAPRKIWPRPCAFPKRKVSPERANLTQEAKTPNRGIA